MQLAMSSKHEISFTLLDYYAVLEYKTRNVKYSYIITQVNRDMLK